MSTSRGKRLILEGKVEEYLVDQVELYGGRADKFCTPGRRGPPDRLITWPRVGWAKMELVEVKTLDEYGRPTSLDPLQVQDHKERAALGCIVRVIWTKAQVDEYIRYELNRRGAKLDALLVGKKEWPGGVAYDVVKVPRKRAKIAPAGEEFGTPRGAHCDCSEPYCGGCLR
jgi:hypothetical protein